MNNRFIFGNESHEYLTGTRKFVNHPLDPTNGHIKNDTVALKYWSREYQPGWEPKI